MRILYIANMNRDSGVACFLLNYVRCMDRSQLEIDFLCWDTRDDNFHEEIEALGGHVICIKSYKKNPVAFLHGIYQTIHKGHYDIIHGHEAIMSIPAFFVGKRKGVKNRIAHSHNAGMPTKTKDMTVKICRGIFKRVCTEYMACSEMAGEYLFGKTAFEAKGRTICNAIDAEKFRFSKEIRKRIRTELGIEEDTFVVGHVGRFNIQKNHQYLIKIFNEMTKSGTDTKLMLIGDGETRCEVEAQAEEYEIADKILLLGIRDNVYEYMQAMDVFVFPSVFEGLGIVLIEAQAAGLLCVASTEVPREAQCGDMLAYLDLRRGEKEWAEKILCLKDKKILREDGINCVRMAGYDIHIAVQELQDYYFEMMR